MSLDFWPRLRIKYPSAPRVSYTFHLSIVFLYVGCILTVVFSVPQVTWKLLMAFGTITYAYDDDASACSLRHKYLIYGLLVSLRLTDILIRRRGQKSRPMPKFTHEDWFTLLIAGLCLCRIDACVAQGYKNQA